MSKVVYIRSGNGNPKFESIYVIMYAMGYGYESGKARIQEQDVLSPTVLLLTLVPIFSGTHKGKLIMHLLLMEALQNAQLLHSCYFTKMNPNFVLKRGCAKLCDHFRCQIPCAR